MMSWKKQVPRVTKRCIKIKITLSERIGKIYERIQNQWVKDSERKTTSESEVNERETW
jgi:hypothetical protein